MDAVRKWIRDDKGRTSHRVLGKEGKDGQTWKGPGKRRRGGTLSCSLNAQTQTHTHKLCTQSCWIPMVNCNLRIICCNALTNYIFSKEYIKVSHSETVQQQQQQPFNGRLSGTTRVGRYQKKHSPAHTRRGQRTSFITVRAEWLQSLSKDWL